MSNIEPQNTCLNCAHIFTGAFCSACGQKHGPPMPTATELASDFLRSAMSPAGKIFESLRTLLLIPGELSRVYFAGQRLRYVHPVRLYLLGVFLFVTATSLNNTWREWNAQPRFEAAVGEVFAQHDKASSDSAKSEANDTSKKSGEELGRTMKQVLPGWMLDWIKHRAERSKDLSAEQLREKALRAASSQYSLLFALMVPFMAAINWMLYRRRGVNYAGHIVFMLHVNAAMCLMMVPMYLINLPIIYIPIFILTMVWNVLAARRAFGVSLWGALWRYLSLMIPIMILGSIVGLVMAAFVVQFA
jgi:Protein of unknown function (DUF3667)